MSPDLWSCPFISSFWRRVITCNNFYWSDLLCLCSFNYISVSWRWTTIQHRWTLCALTTPKILILEHWKDRYPPPVIQWKEDLTTLLTNAWQADSNYTWMYFWYLETFHGYSLFWFNSSMLSPFSFHFFAFAL